MGTHSFLSRFFLSFLSQTSPSPFPFLNFLFTVTLISHCCLFFPSDFSLLYVLLLSPYPFVPFFFKTRTNLTVWILQNGESRVAPVPQWRWRKQVSLWGQKQGKVHFEEAICPSGFWLICWRLPVTQSVWSNWFFNKFLSGEKQTCRIDFDEVVDQKDCFVSEESRRRVECFFFYCSFYGDISALIFPIIENIYFPH